MLNRLGASFAADITSSMLKREQAAAAASSPPAAEQLIVNRAVNPVPPRGKGTVRQK
jgi:hypothetical protein